MSRKTKAVIFDMDGVLIDSEAYWHQVDPQDIYGCPLTDEMKRAIIGLKEGDIIDLLQKTYNISIQTSYVDMQNDVHGRRIYGSMGQLCDGVSALIDRLHSNGILLAVASSSQTKWIEMVLGRFGIREKFHTVLSTTTNNLPGKPQPDVYTLAMKALGVLPMETVIIEDSHYGFTAAKAAGARVIAVPHVLTNHYDFTSADLLVETLVDERVHAFLDIQNS